jgi:two-component system, OmpR family, KDP operon response regulator KdpE
MTRVLVVDDDPSLRKALRIGLEARGYAVVSAQNGTDGITQVAMTSPDVVVLDLGLGDIDGIDVCRQIRSWTSVPIVVLSAAGTEERKVAALDLGADDYMTKPFSMAELEARLRTALRHSGAQKSEPSVFRVGEFTFDMARQTASRADTTLDLTAHEFALLAFLAQNASKVCTHEMILKHVWGTGYADEANYVRVYVHRLRRKLSDSRGEILRNHPGIGYEFVAN